MRLAQRVSGVLVALCLVTAPARTDEGASPAANLASEFARAAQNMLQMKSLPIEAVEAATILVQEAVALAPENPEWWRLLLDLAVLGEQEETKEHALDRLLELDPDDEFARLMRINGRIDRYQRVEERIAAYERLLSEEHREELAPAIASRLAFDLALLYRRHGDVEAFAGWLAEAVNLDSSHRAAAAMAAGYFRANVEDPVAEAELLVMLMLADPADVAAQVSLAQLLLERGAYASAERIYEMAVKAHRAAGAAPANELLADYALAQWGGDNAEGALRTIRGRQQETDWQVRRQGLENDPEKPSYELAKLSGLLSPTLATVRAAIHAHLGHEKAAGSFQSAVRVYELVIEGAKEGEAPEAALAQAYLDLAWMSVSLGGDPEQAAMYLAQAEDRQALTETARRRFNGWLSYRRGEYERALELLSPLAEEDSASALGAAEVYLEQGQRREAARQLLRVARRQPGTLMGVWSANRLAALLGRRVPLTDEEAHLDELIASIPEVVDHVYEDASLAILLRVTPVESLYGPYEPIMVDVELTNAFPFPLSIDRDGPLRPQMVIIPSVRIAHVRAMNELAPIVIDIGRRLRLEPRERMTIQVDLRRYAPGEALDRYPTSGALISLRGMTNFISSATGRLRPGVLGSEADMTAIRVDGVDMTMSWLDETLSVIAEPDSFDDLRRMALLSLWLQAGEAQLVPLEHRSRLPDAAAALEGAYALLDAPAQAWLLSVIGRSQAVEPILAMAGRSDERVVLMSLLMFQSKGLDDPVFDAAERSEDARVRRLGGLMRQVIRRLREPGAAGQEP